MSDGDRSAGGVGTDRLASWYRRLEQAAEELRRKEAEQRQSAEEVKQPVPAPAAATPPSAGATPRVAAQPPAARPAPLPAQSPSSVPQPGAASATPAPHAAPRPSFPLPAAPAIPEFTPPAAPALPEYAPPGERRSGAPTATPPLPGAAAASPAQPASAASAPVSTPSEQPPSPGIEGSRLGPASLPAAPEVLSPATAMPEPAETPTLPGLAAGCGVAPIGQAPAPPEKEKRRAARRPARDAQVGDASPDAATTAALLGLDLWVVERLSSATRGLLVAPERETAQHYYTKPFEETRTELIRRLLDPPLTLEEAARILNVCPMTVRRYTNRGSLPHFRTVGDQRRFRLSDVLAFLERQGRAPESAEEDGS